MSFHICILAAVLGAAVPSAPPTRTSFEATADSLYAAGAVDSLFSFSTRIMDNAARRGDRVLVGRMTYHRGRARLALRDPGAPADFDRALAIATERNDSLGRMQAVGLKAFVLVNQGRFEESVRLNEERIALARALGERGSEGWGHLLIGYASLYRQDLPRARSEYEEAWRAFADAARPRDQLAASIGLARALDRMGNYDDARASYQRAWLTARELDDRAQEADVINNLGVMEQEHGELSLAAQYYARALEMKRELRAFDLANTAQNVATVDQMIGRYAHAESTLVDAMALATNNALDVAMAVQLGRLRLAQGRLTGATQCLRGLLAQKSRLARQTHVEATTLMAEALVRLDSVPAAIAMLDRGLSSDPPSAWRTEALLQSSRVFRAGGDSPHALDAALAAWEDARTRSDSTLMVLAASQVSLSERAPGNNAGALWWLERARDAFEASRFTDEFQWREARRALLAHGLIESGDILRVYPADTDKVERDRAWFDFLQQVNSRTLLERVTDPRRFDDIDPALARPVTSRVLQAGVLRAGECLVSVSVANAGVHVFVMTPDFFSACMIDDPDGRLVSRFQNFARVSAANEAPKAAVRFPSAASMELGRLLFDGSDAVIRGAARVYVATDGALAGAPFETLVCPGETGPLLAAHEVVRVPSPAFFHYLRARRANVSSPASLLAVAADTRALSGARDEVNLLHARYGAVRALQPDRANLLDNLSRFDVIHIASHVHLDAERPWNAGILIGPPDVRAERSNTSPAAGPLALSPADSSEIAEELPSDPFVRASEVASHRLAADLVVLSACESALGRATFAEGVVGLASSFLCAGARVVVASLWEVDDRTTAQLMERFYGELAAGKTVAAALRNAALGIREKHPEPFYWAGFVVLGDGDVTVDLTRHRETNSLWLALLGVTLMAAVPWAIWRRRPRRDRIDA